MKQFRVSILFTEAECLCGETRVAVIVKTPDEATALTEGLNKVKSLAPNFYAAMEITVKWVNTKK